MRSALPSPKYSRAAPKRGRDPRSPQNLLPIGALEQKLRDSPAVDAARVAAVRQKLDDGSYQIDPMRIADKLLGLERDLVRKDPK